MAQIADQPSGGCIYHFEPTRAPHPFFSGGKRFLCSNPGNKLTLYHWKKGFTQNARSGTRVFKTRVLNAQTYRTNMGTPIFGNLHDYMNCMHTFFGLTMIFMCQKTQKTAIQPSPCPRSRTLPGAAG